MLIEFHDTEGKPIFINTREVLTVKPGEGDDISVKLTNGDTIQLNDPDRRVVDDINRGMATDNI